MFKIVKDCCIIIIIATITWSLSRSSISCSKVQQPGGLGMRDRKKYVLGRHHLIRLPFLFISPVKKEKVKRHATV